MAQYYLQNKRPGFTSGNCVIFKTDDDGNTTDINKARKYEKDRILSTILIPDLLMTENSITDLKHPYEVYWLCEHIESRTRLTVNVQNLH